MSRPRQCWRPSYARRTARRPRCSGARLHSLPLCARPRPPSAVILDWRLEHELSAALFLATRHRHPRLPVIYWTGSTLGALPSMISDDRWARIVDKATGTEPFEEALAWALAQADAREPEDRPSASRAGR